MSATLLGKLMRAPVEVIQPQATIQEAAAIMRAYDIGSLIVADGADLAGLVTDRDITIRATAMGMHPKTTRVEGIMTTTVFYCFEDEDVIDAAQVMAEKGIRRLPILDRSHALVGIVTLGQLARADMETARVVLEIIMQSERDRRNPMVQPQDWPQPFWS